MADSDIREAPVHALDADEMIEAARVATGLRDFGEPDVRGPLDALATSLNLEADLTPQGAAAKRRSLLRALSNRLLLQDALAAAPEIETQRIRSPIVVVGLPRTGTTKLHRAVAADPAMQKLPLWRLLEPVLRAPATPDEPDPRIARAEAYVAGMRAAAPHAYAAHPMYAEQPDEEVFVMEIAFLANINATAFRAPGFDAWLGRQSFESWYVWFKRLLQYIQHADGSEGRPWVLKAPHHLGFLPLLFRHFPDATVVHCHRDPLVTLPSFASLAYSARRSSSFGADPAEAGRYVLDYCARRMNTYVADRAALDRESRFVDIAYRDIVKDAPAAIRRIYEAAGLPLTQEAIAAAQAWEAENAQHKHGDHRYALADFSIDPDEARSAFATYHRRFQDYL